MPDIEHCQRKSNHVKEKYDMLAGGNAQKVGSKSTKIKTIQLSHIVKIPAHPPGELE